MNKKLISAAMAAVTALSLSASAFAAAASDPSHCEAVVTSNLQIPTITIKYPTTAGVVFNPYKMSLTTATNGSVTVDKTGTKGDTSTIVSPELEFVNTGDSEVAIKVTASVTATTTFNDKGESLGNDADGNPIVNASKKVTFATAPIKQPSYDKTGKLVAGETKNVVLLYLEVGQPKTEGSKVTYEYSDAYDKNNANQMILSNKDTTKTLFQVSNVATGSKNVAHIKLCGDVATTPTIGWDQIAKTETINVKLIYDASPVAPLPEKPAETTP